MILAKGNSTLEFIKHDTELYNSNMKETAYKTCLTTDRVFIFSLDSGISGKIHPQLEKLSCQEHT